MSLAVCCFGPVVHYSQPDPTPMVSVRGSVKDWIGALVPDAIVVVSKEMGNFIFLRWIRCLLILGGGFGLLSVGEFNAHLFECYGVESSRDL